MARPVEHYGKYRIRWIDVGGARRSETYDNEEEADLALRRHELRAIEARRAGPRPEPVVRLFKDVVANWMVTRAKEKRSQRDDDRMTRCHLLPAFQDLPLEQLTTQRVQEWAATWTQSPKTLHNVLTLFVSLLNHAIDLGWMREESKPRVRKPRVHVAEDDYAWIRTGDDLRRFLVAALEESRGHRALYATAVYTGMRQGELAGLRWGAVSLKTRLITVRRSYDGPTKSGRVRHVPIFDALLPVLQDWHDLDDNGRSRVVGEDALVFPNSAGNMLCKSAPAFQQAFHRTLVRAGLEEKDEAKRGGTRGENGRRALCFHSLRHTFASHWMMNGGDLYKLRKIGGWRSDVMVQRYAHLSPTAYRDDLGRFGEAPALAPAAVVPIR